MTPMTRTAKRLYDLEIDEISLVDRPANQHATVAIAKRDEDTMTVIDAEGNEVTDLTVLEPGDVVYDADSGEPLIACEDGAEPTDYYTQEALDEAFGEQEPELVGKASPLMAIKPMQDAAKGFARRRSVQAGAAGLAGVGAGRLSKSLGSQVYEELSKALTDEGRNTVVSKALAEADARVAAAESKADQAVQIAKGLADTLEHSRLTEVAKGYGVPGKPEELAEILKGLSPTHAQYLDRVLSSAGEQLFEAYGADQGEVAVSIHGQIEALAQEAVGKSDVSTAEAITALYTANPDAYDAYLAESY